MNKKTLNGIECLNLRGSAYSGVCELDFYGMVLGEGDKWRLPVEYDDGKKVEGWWRRLK